MMWKSHPGGPGSKAWRGYWRTPEAWYCERSGEEISECTELVVVEVP